MIPVFVSFPPRSHVLSLSFCHTHIQEAHVRYTHTHTQSTRLHLFHFILKKTHAKENPHIWCSFLHQWPNALKFILCSEHHCFRGEDKVGQCLHGEHCCHCVSQNPASSPKLLAGERSRPRDRLRQSNSTPVRGMDGAFVIIYHRKDRFSEQLSVWGDSVVSNSSGWIYNDTWGCITLARLILMSTFKDYCICQWFSTFLNHVHPPKITDKPLLLCTKRELDLNLTLCSLKLCYL